MDVYVLSILSILLLNIRRRIVGRLALHIMQTFRILRITFYKRSKIICGMLAADPDSKNDDNTKKIVILKFIACKYD